MKKRKPIIAIIALVVCTQILSSCMSYNNFGKSLNNSLGRETDYLRMEFGPPNYVLENGDIGTIWVYSDTYVRNTPGYIGKFGYYYLYNAPSSYEYEASYRFWVDNNNRVRKWSCNGYQPKRLNALGWIMCTVVPFTATWLFLDLIFG